MYSSIEAAAFQRDAAKFKLKYPAIFVEMTAGELAAIANGYGPENWDEEVRKVLNWIFRKYPVPAAIHDVRYEFSDGRELTRKAADAEFASGVAVQLRKTAFCQSGGMVCLLEDQYSGNSDCPFRQNRMA